MLDAFDAVIVSIPNLVLQRKALVLQRKALVLQRKALVLQVLNTVN